jgi:uncharacterized membrane protein
VRVTHRTLLAVVALVAVAAVAGMALQWPADVEEPETTDEFVDESEQRDATIRGVVELPTDVHEPSLLPGSTIVELTAEIDDTGEFVTFETTDETGDTYASGQRVRLATIPTDTGPSQYYVTDFRRGTPLIVLSALFVVAVLAFARFQGLRSLIGLGLTFVVIVGFIVPAILDGRSPVAVALAGSLAIMIVTLYLSHGLGPKTSAAVVGTVGALLLTVGLATLFTSAATLTGFTSEDARLANFSVGGLSLRGLLLAGIIIGGLGVLDDVTMSQSSTVFALRRANPSMPFVRLFAEGLSVGRDHIAATVNTLFLAYAGAALPLLILLSTGAEPLGSVLTSEIVAVEIVRTLVGSLGLIAAVPVTTALAAAVALGEDPEAVDAAGGPVVDPHAHGVVGGSAAPTAHGTGDRADDGGQDRPAAGAGAGAPEPEEGDEAWVRQLRSAYRLPEDR